MPDRAPNTGAPAPQKICARGGAAPARAVAVYPWPGGSAGGQLGLFERDQFSGMAEGRPEHDLSKLVLHGDVWHTPWAGAAAHPAGGDFRHHSHDKFPQPPQPAGGDGRVSFICDEPCGFDYRAVADARGCFSVQESRLERSTPAFHGLLGAYHYTVTGHLALSASPVGWPAHQMADRIALGDSRRRPHPGNGVAAFSAPSEEPGWFG